MMRVLIAALLALPGQALGQVYDHLEPDDSIFGYEWSRDYYSNVAQVLGSVVPDGSPRVYVLPSNMNEYVIGIDDEEEPCRVVFGRAEYTIWVYESRKQTPELYALTSDFPEDPRSVAVEVSSQPVPADQCERIRGAWTAVLLRTRYPDPDEARLGLDGVSFRFSVWQRGLGMLSGKTWSPERQTVPGKLVALSLAMRNYARSGDRDSYEPMVRALAEVELALESAR